MAEATEELDSTNQSTEEVDNTEEIEETDSESGTEDLNALQEKNKRLFERAKKAEAEAKLLKAERLKKEEQAKTVQPKVEQPSQKQDGLTPMDAIILGKSDISETEDIEEVINFAGYRKMSIPQALKDKTLQAILSDRKEQRATAEATNTSTARRGTSKPTDEQLIANAEAGKYPEDAETLAEARINLKKKK
jgi:hypothetical protein